MLTLLASLLASLKSLLNCTKALCPECTVNTGTGSLSWWCCGEAPAAGFAAGMGLVLARAIGLGLSPATGRVTPAAALSKCLCADQTLCGCTRPQQGICTPAAASVLLRTSQGGGMDETFGNPPWGWMQGQGAGPVCQPLVRQSLGNSSYPETLWEVLECYVSQIPGAEIPSLPWGNFPQGLPSLAGSSRSPDPSPPLLPRPGAQLPVLGIFSLPYPKIAKTTYFI